MNTKINRKKLKITKFFDSQKVIPKLINKNSNNNLTHFSPERKIHNSFLLTYLKTENNDINNYLTSTKINIKKKLKQNKTDYNYNTQIQANNKKFYKINIPLNEVKSFSDLSNISNNLIRSNYSSHMTQTSLSFLNNKENDKSKNLRKIQNIKKLELNDTFNTENKSNNVTYIEYHINQILSKKKEKNIINNNINTGKKLVNINRNIMLKFNKRKISY